MNEKTIFEKAYDKIHRPMPHIESLYGWRLSTKHCFAQAGGNSRFDFGGHQCGNKPKYHIGKIQFCTTHAKQIDPTLLELQKIENPIWEKEFIRPKERK